MRRTQLYLDDGLWAVLHARAASEKTTISELVRTAVRQCYLGDLDRRQAAMRAVIGIRKLRKDELNATEEIRALRRGSRLDRIERT